MISNRLKRVGHPLRHSNHALYSLIGVPLTLAQARAPAPAPPNRETHGLGLGLGLGLGRKHCNFHLPRLSRSAVMMSTDRLRPSNREACSQARPRAPARARPVS